MAWKARDAAQDILKRQLVGPDKCHATAKSCELGLELSTPELADGSGPDHHEDLPGLGEYPQNVIDQARKIVDDRDRTLVLAKWALAEPSLIHRGEEERRPREKLPPMLAREYSRGAAGSHNEVRGRPIGIHGSDVVDDGLFGRADKPCRAHDDLNDVHGFPGSLVQAYAEVAGEVIENQVPAVERLQHQDLFDRGLSFARRRNDH